MRCIKRLTGLDEVMAKGFVQKDRAYVAAYFLEGEARQKGLWDGKTLAIDRQALANRLPQYMLPTYYVPLDAFPVNANGKLTRKGLEAPSVEDARKPYAEPHTEAEKILYDAMARVLQVDRMGAEDDFFACGGDSLRAIELVSACERLDLSTTDVYTHRTARGIAAHVSMLAEDSSAGRLSDDAMSRDLEVEHPLLPGQLINIIFQSYLRFPASVNMARLFLPRKDVDLDRLCRALNRAVLLHPALRTMIYQNEDARVRRDTYFSNVAEFWRKQGGFAWRTAEAYYANLFQDEPGTSIRLGRMLVQRLGKVSRNVGLCRSR